MPDVVTCTNTKAALGAAETRQWIRTVLVPLADKLGAAGFFACLPDPLLPMAVESLSGTGIGVGAQDAWYETGNYTGETPAALLCELGCTHVMIGHADRRARGESDELIARKVAGAHAAGLTPVVCLGERDHLPAAVAAEAICGQFDGIVRDLSAEAVAALLVLYEPAWAIGGRAAAPGHVAIVCRTLRRHAARHGRPPAILYGGGVEPDTYPRLLAAAAPIAGVGLGRVVHRREILEATLDTILRTPRK
ncbi:triose-phosphate isomerase family protein [Nocardia sp. BMG51109]|uniref:triose-phosphate isomerase family protein n=1 Tax=Nocardia sp. BMG51109 TaxID=1056816 RepID=UPI0004663E1D|nr:triose-phosphate isomerase family protein [Nocardia sp. BMG51109]